MDSLNVSVAAGILLNSLLAAARTRARGGVGAAPSAPLSPKPDMVGPAGGRDGGSVGGDKTSWALNMGALGVE